MSKHYMKGDLLFNPIFDEVQFMPNANGHTPPPWWHLTHQVAVAKDMMWNPPPIETETYVDKTGVQITSAKQPKLKGFSKTGTPVYEGDDEEPFIVNGTVKHTPDGVFVEGQLNDGQWGSFKPQPLQQKPPQYYEYPVVQGVAMPKVEPKSTLKFTLQDYVTKDAEATSSFINKAIQQQIEDQYTKNMGALNQLLMNMYETPDFQAQLAVKDWKYCNLAPEPPFPNQPFSVAETPFQRRPVHWDMSLCSEGRIPAAFSYTWHLPSMPYWGIWGLVFFKTPSGGPPIGAMSLAGMPTTITKNLLTIDGFMYEKDKAYTL
jgi:hypothetical protein